jgi:hypothetical protein
MESEVSVCGGSAVNRCFPTFWMVDLPVVDGIDEEVAIVLIEMDGGRLQVCCLLLFMPHEPSKGISLLEVGLKKQR